MQPWVKEGHNDQKLKEVGTGSPPEPWGSTTLLTPCHQTFESVSVVFSYPALLRWPQKTDTHWKLWVLVPALKAQWNESDSPHPPWCSSVFSLLGVSLPASSSANSSSFPRQDEHRKLGGFAFLFSTNSYFISGILFHLHPKIKSDEIQSQMPLLSLFSSAVALVPYETGSGEGRRCRGDLSRRWGCPVSSWLWESSFLLPSPMTSGT